jgi:hypothetical protein
VLKVNDSGSSKLSEPACYGRHKREGNPRTCLNGRKVRREEKHEAQTEEERDLGKGSVPIKPHGASVGVTGEVWHGHTSIA